MAAALGLPPPLTQMEGLLGDVEQAEIVVENPDDLAGGFGIQIVQGVHHLLATHRIAIARNAREPLLHLLDQTGDFRSTLNLEHPGQHRVQQPQGTAKLFFVVD
jgi:hypothetical protein